MLPMLPRSGVLRDCAGGGPLDAQDQEQAVGRKVQSPAGTKEEGHACRERSSAAGGEQSQLGPF